MNNVLPLTRACKYLIITISSVWFMGQVIIEQYFLKDPIMTSWLALTPIAFLRDYFVWQPFTYLFVHDVSPLPVIFNLLLIWWLGSELERRWGSRFFTIYYLSCGIAAGLFYACFALVYSIVKSQGQLLLYPLMGAQASIFGLMVAYAMVYGERVVSFMFLFPMKAKHFVLILAAIELVMALNQSAGGQRWASLSHLAGFVTGYLILKLMPIIQNNALRRKKKSQKLKLVVNNTDFNKEDKPKYWH